MVVFIDFSPARLQQFNWLLESWRFSGAQDAENGVTDVVAVYASTGILTMPGLFHVKAHLRTSTKMPVCCISLVV
jgi:hypothetical protein